MVETDAVSDEVRATTLADPWRALLAAVTAISSDLDLHSVLIRIIASATEITGARYGALGVIGGGDEGMVEFITTGMDRRTQELIGDQPTGRGILRLLIDEPGTIRLNDLSAHPKFYGFPPHHPPMASFLGVSIRIRGTVFGNLYLTQKVGGAPFTDEDEILVQALATAAGLVIDNARAYGLNERRRQWLEAAAELAELLQPPIDLTRALHQIAMSARAVSGASTAAVISLPAAQLPEIEGLDGPRGPLGPELLQKIAAAITRRGGATDSIEVRLDQSVAVAIPLRAHLADRGALVAVYDAGYRADDIEERELLASFADQAALALDRAQALLDREELAVTTDRGRIALDLHDLVIQRLFATGLQLQAIQSAAVYPETSVRIGKAVDDLDLTIRDIRRTIFELQRPASESLRADVRALVRGVRPDPRLHPGRVHHRSSGHPGADRHARPPAGGPTRGAVEPRPPCPRRPGRGGRRGGSRRGPALGHRRRHRPASGDPRERPAQRPSSRGRAGRDVRAHQS